MADDTSKPSVKPDYCAHCGCRTTTRHVKIDQSTDAERIRLSYHAPLQLRVTDQIFADLCEGCGSLLGVCVDVPDGKWVAG
jgi:hypothetical protein